ncbi:MAG: hypothetical protein AAGE80_05020 [Pseudomonadota bacterium]
MTSSTTRYGLAFAGFMLFAPPAGAAEVIVSREGDGVAVYFQIPLTDVAGLFGREAIGLVNTDGEIDLDNLSQGTFEDADLLAQDVEFTLGDQDVEFEALSMMVHQAENPFAFETPLDAELAIGVCNVPLPEHTPKPEQMVWAGGWYAYPVSSSEALTINFPATGRDPMEISVRIFDSATLERTEKITLADDGTLVVPQAGGWRQWLAGW